MKWSVYKIAKTVTKGGVRREAIPLGYVNAPNQPQALAAAWKRWPKHMDSNQTQAGFTVREYVKDSMSLGKNK